MPFKQVHFDLPRWVIIVLIWAPFLMGSIGTFAVIRGQANNEANCDAVKGLRQDLVEVVKDGAKRSETTLTDAFDGAQRDRLLRNLHEQTRITLDKINNPDCP